MKNNSTLEIEEALLGLVLANPKKNNIWGQIFIHLDEESFSDLKTQKLFSVLKEFNDKAIPLDIKLIFNYINENNIGNILTLKYINFVIDNAGYMDSLNDYQNFIRENAAKLKLKRSLNTIYKNIDNSPSSSIIETIRNDLYDIEERKKLKDFEKAEDIIDSVIENIFNDTKELKGIPTGFHTLDDITGGLQKGDLIILAARPSVGKTAFALNIATNVSIHNNKHVAFFSFEMPSEQLLQRIVSSVALVDSNKLKHSSRLTENDKSKILLASETKIKKSKLFFDDSGSIKIDEIIWKSRKQKQLGMLDLIIIDYLQLIPTSNSGDNRQQEVSKISRSLKQLARELEVPIIALSQLNRRVETREDKKPMMSDLRESGAIEQDADIIAFLYREDYYDNKSNNENGDNAKPTQQITELNLAKHRNGSTGTIELIFDTRIGKFSDYNKN